MELPTTLMTPSAMAPRALASCSAASVSAVSPDWLTATTTLPSLTMGLR